jgi:hypothetical protein
MDWQPKSPITSAAARKEPTKPSERGSVGFEGSLESRTPFERDSSPQQDCRRVRTPSREIHAIPKGVRIIEWKLKDPPVAIETCAVVTHPSLFAESTLRQLHTALANPKRWVGWSVAELINRLAQVGVIVAVEHEDEKHL